MDWKDCKDKKIIKKVHPDEKLINSLISSSKKKLESNRRLKLDKVTATTKISIAYDSLRETLEALAIKKGFKIYNHECFCAFLGEKCNNKSFSIEFDRFRRIRNKLNYYGTDISLNGAKTIIKGIILLRKNIIRRYLKEIR